VDRPTPATATLRSEIEDIEGALLELASMRGVAVSDIPTSGVVAEEGA